MGQPAFAELWAVGKRACQFGGQLGFSNQMWRRSRNAPGAEQDPALNEPDFIDALRSLLAERGRGLFDEIVGFARARWYTGERANGSLPGGPVIPEVAHKQHRRKANAEKTRFSVSPQVLGTSYVVVERATTDPATLWVSLSSQSQAARFTVQAVGGAADDAVLDLSDGPARVRFGSGRKVTLVVTALPADERIAWTLRHVERHRLENVAALVGCSLATAKRRIGRAQAFLEEHFVSPFAEEA